MQNDFENKVKQKLEEFILSPTDAVWQNVASKIAKEKRRRRIVFFWWMGAVILIGGALGLLTLSPEKTPAKVETEQLTSLESKKAEKSNSKTNTPAIPNEAQATQAEKAEPKTSDDKISSADNKSINQNKEVVAKKEPANNSTESNKVSKRAVAKNINRNNPLSKRPLQKGDEITASKKDKKITTDLMVRANEEEKKIGASSSSQPAEDDKNNTAEVVAQANKTVKAGVSDSSITHQDSSLAAIDKKPLIKEFDTATVALSAKPKNAKSLKKIKPLIGFTIYAGASDNITGFPLLPGSEKSFDAMPTNTTGSGVVTQVSKLQYNTGFSFGFGAYVQQTLSKRWSLTAGIDYHYLSTSTATGGKVNGLLNFFDSLANTSVTLRDYYNAYPSPNFSTATFAFTNKYHFIQLPFNFQLNLNSRKRRPFILSTGLTPGYLVRSHALNFNRYRQVSYTDKDQFKKFQLSAQGGFSFNLLNAKKYSIQLGPELRYGISNLSKPTTDTKQHLFFFGLKANVIPRQ